MRHLYPAIILSLVALTRTWPQHRQGMQLYPRIRGPNAMALHRGSLSPMMVQRPGLWGYGMPQRFGPATAGSQIRPHYAFMRGPQPINRLQAMLATSQWNAQQYRPLVKDNRPLGTATQSGYDFLNLRQPTTMLLPFRIDGDGGPIRTIPAPNLSLADKPIIVMPETNNHLDAHTYYKPGFPATKDQQDYEVTEPNHDPDNFNRAQFQQQHNTEPSLPTFNSAQQALSFSQTPQIYNGVLTSSDILQLLRGQYQQQQLADTYPLPILQQPQLLRHTALGQNVRLQAFNPVLQTVQGNDPQLLKQSILFKPDPDYVQKLQGQFVHHPLLRSNHYRIKPESLGQAEALRNDKETDQNIATTANQYAVVRKSRDDAANAIQPKGFQASQLDTSSFQAADALIAEATTVAQVTTRPPLEMKDDAVSPTFYSQIGKTDNHLSESTFYSTVPNQESQATNLESIEKVEPVADVKPNFLSAENVANKTDEPFRPMTGTDHMRQIQAINESIGGGSPIRIFVSEQYDDIETHPPKITSRHDNHSTEQIVRIYSNYEKPSESKQPTTTEKADKYRGTHKHSASIASLSKFLEDWRSGTKSESQKPSGGAAANNIEEFGQKLRPKMDDYDDTLLVAE